MAAMTVLYSGLKGGTELLVNVVTSGIIEGLFPPFNPDRSPWLNLIEGTVEITVYLLIAGSTSASLATMFGLNSYARLPYGSLLMFWLMEGAVQKIMHFVGYISDQMNKRRMPVEATKIDLREPDDSPSRSTTMYDLDGDDDNVSSLSTQHTPSMSPVSPKSSCNTGTCDSSY